MSDENRNPAIWTIVERFFRSESLYREQHDRYEGMVASYVEKFKKPRQEIRLQQEELSGLLDFKQLEKIRDSYLLPLKDVCHEFFRHHNATDFLDRLVNDIFHEISILKEEHYNVLTYARGGEEEDEDLEAEMQVIFDEVHEMFPIKVHRLRHLFERARKRLETIIPRHGKNEVLVRSLFLNREGFVGDAFADGLLGWYRIIYGESRAFDGFLIAGDSFFRSGFYEQARDCFAAGEEYLHGVPPAAKRRLDPGWKAAREHFKKSIRRCRDKLAALEED